MQANFVIFSIFIPKNVFFEKIKQTKFCSHQISKYFKYAWI